MEKLILVNWNDECIGLAEKQEAHLQQKLHRAFSVLILSADGKMLIQKRAEGKYHSAGLYANACCSHPREGETLVQAVARRTLEELGVQILDATEIGAFIYLAPFENGLYEYEYDHVFIKVLNQEESKRLKNEAQIPFNRDEIESLMWITREDLMHWVKDEREKLAYWFWLILNDQEMNKKLWHQDEK